MKMMPNWLKQRAFLTPERIALEEGNQVLTFRDLDKRVASLAEHLSFAGVGKGHHVAVLMRNSIEMVYVIHALSYIGAIAVLLNTRLSQEELFWQIENAEVHLLITDDNQHIMVDNHRIYKYTYEQLLALPSVAVPFMEEFAEEETMTIIYTSGTTGNPKGVKLTYGNHWWSAVGSALNLGLTEKDCWLACLPFFHVGGLSILLKNVIYGMRIVILKRADANQINEKLLQCDITMISVVSKVLTDMIRLLLNQDYPKTLRCVLLGGGPAPKPLLEACVEKHIPVFQSYGMTETASQICTLSSDYMLLKVGSAGKPLFPCQFRIEKDGKTLSAGEAGEIVVKGPNVTNGYWKQDDATKQSIVDGWLHTGDIGYSDEEGFLYVLDRRNDLIISGGENIYPAQIEEVLLAHPLVLEAGVVGIDDENWGQVPVAFVKVEKELTEKDLLVFCQERLARYKVPKHIYYVNELPRNASNKLLRRELKGLLR
ncbi:o-succinylbenzoate--CoA ligase [Ectobacillus sp. sgz5001026]|uniref:o-succinylbenzoate--CoA ligase n=1 Tax=Ectobacillus sp. sgz5001026 TaxID=3242473 RepID=UPI0036D261A0